MNTNDSMFLAKIKGSCYKSGDDVEGKIIDKVLVRNNDTSETAYMVLTADKSIYLVDPADITEISIVIPT